MAIRADFTSAPSGFNASSTVAGPAPAEAAVPQPSLNVGGGVIGKRPDPLTRLTGEPHDRLDAMRSRRDEMQAYLWRLLDQKEELREEKLTAESNYQKLIRPGQPQNADAGPEIARRKKKVEELVDELNKLGKKIDDISDRRKSLGRLTEDCERYVRAFTVKPLPTKTKGRTAALSEITESIAQLRADLHEVRSAPHPSSEARESIRRQIEDLAEQGAPDVSRLIDHGASQSIHWPSEVHARNGATGEIERVSPSLAVLAWLRKDELLAALDAEVDAMAEDESALTDQARADRMEKINAEILLLERSEAAAVWAAGDPAALREDLDPRAALAIDGPAPATE